MIQHLRSLQQHDGCSDKLRRLIEFVGEKMLVIEADRRANSREVRDFLSNLVLSHP